MGDGEAFEDAGKHANWGLLLSYLRARPRAQSYVARISVHDIATRASRSEQGLPLLFEGTLVIGLILRSLWGLYKIHETLWFYLVSL